MSATSLHCLLTPSNRTANYCHLLFILILTTLFGCSKSTDQNEATENALSFQQTSTLEASALNTQAANEPNGSITSPATDITTNLGEKLYFSGSGFDPTGSYPLTYHWNFDGLQPNGLTQNPGFITLNRLGTYRVSLTVANQLGIADSSPEVRVIKVKNPNAPVNINPPTTANPLANIVSPVSDLSISVGETIYFSGSGSSPSNNAPLSYLWNFAGATPNSLAQNPGNITFTQPGIYPISLTTTDNAGLKSTNNAVVTITVNAFSTTNFAPTATILSPPGDLTINAGDSIYFTGTALDADANLPLLYSWDFAGAAPNSFNPIPGKVTFNQPGIYPVRLTVSDSLGLGDLDPPIRIITVTDLGVRDDKPLNNVIISPATDITINLGDSVNFQGEGSNGNLAEPLRYLWHFEKLGIESSILQNPGDIVFTREGTFEAQLIIADANGFVVSHEAERKITVIDPNALVAHVHEPATNLNINVGERIFFEPMIINDPLGSTLYEYHWNFDGAASSSNLGIPEPIDFNSVGVYEVKLTIRDPGTGRIARAERIITVEDPNALQVRIITPMANQTINMGDAITFASEAFDPLGVAAIEYMWKFDGVTPDMAVQNPGDIVFSTAGKYRIRLTIRDSATLRTAKSDEIIITVNDPSALMAEITSPSSDMLLYLGESLDYSGMGIDPLNSVSAYMYHWRFGRGVTSNEQNPGIVTYDTPGDFDVKFRVSDPITDRRSKSVKREIHVMPVAAPSSVVANLKGTITSPPSNMTITAGSLVVFEASGVDPNSNGPLTYFWNFDGAALNSTAQNPGAVMFNSPGIYTITLTAINSLGEVDPNPPFVVITVL